MSQQLNDKVREISSDIEKSLDINLKLQEDLQERLLLISKKKKRNRIRYLNLSRSMDKYLFESKVDLKLRQRYKDSQKGVQRDWKITNEGKIKTRRFFIDPDKSVPESNQDTIRRREWEGNLTSSGTNRFVPFSKLEIELLKHYAEDIRTKQQNKLRLESGDESLTIKDEQIDFKAVTEAIASELQTRKLSNFQKAAQDCHSFSQLGIENPDYLECRSWIDYRLKYLCSLSPSINKSPISKQESLMILEALHKHEGNPPWDILAKELSNGRTPFQCFVHAQTKLSNSMSKDINTHQSFTQEEDELLFKFIAASGPQFVIDMHSATLMSQHLFPKTSYLQIVTRANETLMNPAYTFDKWTEDEERLLALSMKVYSQCEKKFTRIAELFPNRSYKSVIDKWNRSLDPSFSTTPFTEQEDADLLEAVRGVDSTTINWKNISQQFPSRKPESLMRRWSEIASIDEVMDVKRESLLQRGLKSVGRNKTTSEGGENVIDREHLVLRVKKRKI